MKKNTLLFSIFIALIPIITIYASPIPGLTIGEILLLISIAFFLYKEKGILVKEYKTTPMGLFIVYIWSASLISGLWGGINTTAIIRMIRFSTYYFAGVFIVSKWIDKDTLSKWVGYVGKISTIFIVIQYISYYALGVYINGKIPFLKLYYDEYSTINYTSMFQTYFFRPTSIFLEPAHYAQYLVLVLSIFLFKNRNYIWAAFISLGIVISTSSQGILIAIAIWAYWILKRVTQKGISRREILYFVITLLAGGLFAGWIIRQDSFINAMSRLNSTNETSALYSRMGVLNAIIDEMTVLSGIFGHGFGNVIEGNWTTPGIGYVLYGAGIPALLLVLWYIIRCWRNGDELNKSAIIAFVLTFVQAGVFMHIQILLYMALMQGDFNNVEEKHDPGAKFIELN